MSRPTVYGPASSLHVRSILFALREKDVIYRVQSREASPVLASGSCRQRMEPVIEGGDRLVEGTETALRFVEDAFGGPSLQPTDHFDRSRMNRALELNYREAVTTLGSRIAGRYVAALVSDEWPDPTAAETVLADARRTVSEFETVLADGPFIAGTTFSLADVAVSSLLDNIMDTPDGALVVPAGSALRAWWDRVSVRDAFKATRPEGGALFGFMYPARTAEH